MDETILTDLVTTPMPYGRYRGTPLYKLPEPYVVWLSRNRPPKGRLGMLLATLYEIKLNGLEYLLEPIAERARRG
ncbi:MAG: DUF3820 family protein [Bacteroidales bacterium]|nr:DUF3820 family protein [Bacteroidales bacterium]